MCQEADKMVPKVFVSSTFYDLKYVRENLCSFIEDYGFSPILSENGDIGYVPYESLDKSCYETMRLSDMAILIVGGRYGSPASAEEVSDKYFSKYKSVTRSEFETACDNQVPVFVFIEAPVFYEYDTYKKNIDLLEDKKLNLNFASVDNINVFRFIAEIYKIKGISVWSFNRIEDIKDLLKKQWAALFLKYLSQSKNNALLKRIEYPISHIDSSIRQMGNLIDKIVEKSISLSPEESDELDSKQIIENAANVISNSFEFARLSINLNDLKDYLTFFVDKLLLAKSNGLIDAWFSDVQIQRDEVDALFDRTDVIIVKVKEYILFEGEVLDKVSDLKDKLVERLLEFDCLRRMKLIDVAD